MQEFKKITSKQKWEQKYPERARVSAKRAASGWILRNREKYLNHARQEK